MIYSFHDINPMAPTHILIIPKEHIASSMNDITGESSPCIARIFEKIPQIAKQAGLTGGYRVICNCGPDADQTILHLHFHLLGGKKLSANLG